MNKVTWEDEYVCAWEGRRWERFFQHKSQAVKETERRCFLLKGLENNFIALYAELLDCSPKCT